MGEGQITFMNGDIQWTDSTELQINPAFSGTTITWTADLDITVNSGLFTITDSRVGAAQTGIVYAADYSANYTDRSLVDREFVDNAIAAAAVSLNTTIAYIEGSTATTIDLDANVGNVKDRNGNNIAFTIPTNPDDMEVYRNGQQIHRTGTLTTRDYSINTGTNEITFVTALTATEIVVIIKRELA